MKGALDAAEILHECHSAQLSLQRFMACESWCQDLL
jgi:hypothetical protein